jgi:Cdc6-like AAA superfamily ATPase
LPVASAPHSRWCPWQARAGPAPGIGRLTAPLIAREREVAALRASRAAALLVTGDPGVGKTRLASEFVRTALTSDRTLDARDAGSGIVLRFTEIARQTPLFAFADLLRDAWSQPATPNCSFS